MAVPDSSGPEGLPGRPTPTPTRVPNVAGGEFASDEDRIDLNAAPRATTPMWLHVNAASGEMVSPSIDDETIAGLETAVCGNLGKRRVESLRIG